MTRNEDDDGYHPEVRPIAEVLASMEAIRLRCGRPMSDDDRKRDFDDALGLLLELRIPRMPDTDEELAEMLLSSSDGPTYTTEEVFERLDAHQRTFSRYLSKYRAAVAEGRLAEAARALLPAVDGGIRWEAGPYAVDMSGEGARSTMRNGQGERVEGEGVDDATALLAAIMAAHVAWRDAWWR
jgi:hypothetical protein